MNLILSYLFFKRKKIFFSFVVSIFLLLCIPLNAQNHIINLKLDHVSLENIFNQVEKQTGFHFLYSKRLIDVDRKVSVSFDGESLTGALNKLFEGLNIIYVINGDQIVLSQKANQNTEEKTVEGTVIDASGEPIVGANVLVKGTQIGRVTNVDGHFSIEAPPTLLCEFLIWDMSPKKSSLTDGTS